jgi:hypothetical protein
MVKQFLRGFSSAMVSVIERLVSKFQQFYATGGSVQMAVIPASGWRRQLWLADPSRAGDVLNPSAMIIAYAIGLGRRKTTRYIEWHLIGR